MAVNILGQLLDLGITPVRLLTESHQNDVVDIASETAAQLRWRAFAAIGSLTRAGLLYAFAHSCAELDS